MSADEIRRTLIAYMESNAIGMPSLATKIEKCASTPIAFTPLHRFLNGAGRTSDKLVQIYGKFAETICKEAQSFT
jgi:hypothetical protein